MLQKYGNITRGGGWGVSLEFYRWWTLGNVERENPKGQIGLLSFYFNGDLEKEQSMAL